MSLLRVNEVKKTYKNGREAIRSVSFQLEKGECLGLVGESGCGKSTLAKTIMRIEDVTSGTIAFNGEKIERLTGRKLHPYRKKMQIVFQNPSAALNPKLKIRDSLLDPIHQFKKEHEGSHFVYTSDDAFVQQLLEAVELPAALADRYPHELSGGQRQRVTIARAISIEPDLIVLDEPTASLDVLSQESVLRLLTELRKTLGLSYLFVSHDLAAVMEMSQRVMVMKDGALVDTFKTSDLYTEDRHDYTKELVSIFGG